ncbi:MAG: hypothetical protein M1817_000556 [Caeruleum heppii]|nr:MAG: hypothetical protein M1817_000556 [Caeruleum heppii]
MSAAPSSSINGVLPAQTQTQQAYEHHFAAESPVESATSYARTMHQHTKRQMELASNPAARRTAEPATISTLSTQSSRASVDSRAS